MVKYAIDFSNGINPYSLNNIYVEQPVNSGCYGFVIPMVLGLFLRLFHGVDALILCEVMTLLSMIVGVTIIGIIAYSCTKSVTLSLTSSIISTICFFFWGSEYTFAMPGQFGVCVSLLLLFLLFYDLKRCCVHPILYAVIIVILFYVKQYFVFLAIPYFILLLFYSAKDAVKYVLSGIIIGISSMLIVNQIFPLYFSLAMVRAQTDTVIFGWWYVLRQFLLLYFSGYFMSICLFITVGFIILLIKLVKREIKLTEIIKCGKINSTHNGSFNISNIIFILSVISLCTFIPISFLSRNRGQECEYYIQMVMPYLVILGMCVFVKLREESKLFFSKVINAVGAILIFISIAAVGNFLIYKPVYQLINNSQTEWKTAYEILDKYGSDRNILVAPHLSYYCYKNDIYTDDYGQAQYNNQEAIDKYNNNQLYQKIFPYFDEFMLVNVNYDELVQNCINEGKYSVIALCEDDGVSFGAHSLPGTYIDESLYEIYDVLMLDTGMQYWKTTFYVRRDLISDMNGEKN